MYVNYIFLLEKSDCEEESHLRKDGKRQWHCYFFKMEALTSDLVKFNPSTRTLPSAVFVTVIFVGFPQLVSFPIVAFEFRFYISFFSCYNIRLESQIREERKITKQIGRSSRYRKYWVSILTVLSLF